MKTTTMVAVLALAAMPGLAAAQTTTGQGGSPPDSTQTGTMNDGAGARRQPPRQGTNRSAAMGRRSAGSRARMGLTRDQVMELQTALWSGGCDAGTADGMIGPRTRRALACARKQHDIQGNDMNALLQALGLSFTVEGNGAMQRGAMSNRSMNSGAMRDSTTNGGASMGRPPATGNSPTMQPPTQSTEPRDSTTRPPGTPD